ncbi:hypothetical protein [Shewanella woodyi]|uniref:hypothetical protein n=1 Tax=Shewanella woodyi TaxID=60961 RepID=UPI0037499B66
MHCIYRIEARPFWNHWQVFSSFFSSLLSLGAGLLAVFAIPALLLTGDNISQIIKIAASLTLLGVIGEGLGLIFHARYLNQDSGEGAAAHYIQQTQFGKSYLARNALMVLACSLSILIIFMANNSTLSIVLAGLLICTVFIYATVGRALFYVLVIPTTMPGAFFGKINALSSTPVILDSPICPNAASLPTLISHSVNNMLRRADATY